MNHQIPSIRSFVTASQLMILCLLCLMIQATAVFGQNFDITIASLTNNNTSAFSNYNDSTESANFGPTTAVDTVGDTIPIDKNLMDMSLNPRSPGNVSHVSVHSLIPSNPGLRWFANSLGWFGDGTGHVSIGVDSTNYAYAVAMVNDLQARGFDGVIFSWYGWYNGVSDRTDILAKNVKAYLQSGKQDGSITNKEFHYILMPVFSYFEGQSPTNLGNFEQSLHYAETNYFTDTNYENNQNYTNNPISTTTNPFIMFFNVENGSTGFNDDEMLAAHEYDTELAKSTWVGETTGTAGGTDDGKAAWADQTYDWTDEYPDGIKDSTFYTDPFNTQQVGQDFLNIGINKKGDFGSMCAHFNGTLTKDTGWSLGKYLESSNGMCEVTRAGIYEANMATNKLMTHMQWATWSDWEEGTECEDGIENWVGMTNEIVGSTLSWAITNGYVETVNHFEIYAQTNGGNAALLCSVPTSTFQTNISGLVPAGSYYIYVYAVGQPCIRNHISPPAAYTETYTGGLPAPWDNEDIGSPGISGSATYNDGIFTVAGSGDDIWSTVDEFQYAYQSGTNDEEMVAEVDSITDTSPWAKAALMFRSSLADDSANGIVSLTPSEGITMQGRTTTGGDTATVNTLADLSVPYWISLVLQGDVLTGYASSNGMSWTTVGTTNISLGVSPYVGLAVTSKSNALLNTSTFGNVSWNLVNPDLPFPWLSADIGGPTIAGSSSDASGTFTVAGSGTDIWGTSDEFQYAYQPWIGDGEIVAEVLTVSNTAPYAKAAIMFRSTLNADSDNTLIAVTPSGITMQCRTNTGADTFTVGTNAVTETAPYWIKLVNQSGVLKGYESSNGSAWTAVGTNTVPLSTSLYIGLAVTSKSNSALNTSTFDNVELTPLP